MDPAIRGDTIAEGGADVESGSENESFCGRRGEPSLDPRPLGVLEHLPALAKCIPFIVTMNAAATDRGAVLFSRAFYDALAQGMEVPEAFAEGRLAIELDGGRSDAAFRLARGRPLVSDGAAPSPPPSTETDEPAAPAPASEPQDPFPPMRDPPVRDDPMVRRDEARKAKSFETMRLKFRSKGRLKFTFLLVGRAGVGKSSTINTLLGRAVQRVGRSKATTVKITRKNAQVRGIRFSVIDTPGLRASSSEIQDRKYLTAVKRRVRRLDSLLFVTRLDERRVHADERRTIELISEILGAKVWERAVIVLTFADKVSPKHYPRDFDERSARIRALIAKQVGKKVADQVPSVAVANDEDEPRPLPTPDGGLWLGELYSQVFARVSRAGAEALYLATRRRWSLERPRRGLGDAAATGGAASAEPTRSADGAQIVLDAKQAERVDVVVKKNAVLSWLERGGKWLMSFLG